ncbi:MAG: ROK family transcriptional regulator, partial [Acidimicrobiia bacterium]|nr:ROK family transcriptional regulator [Acidimicrobiia bacterium]
MTYPDRHTLVRRVNAQRVLEDILEHGPTTRVEVAERTELSKPTVNTLVAKLVEDGIVRQEGQTTGGVGRSATVYAVETRARLVAGIDLGGTKLRIAVADLDGKIIAEGVEPTDRRGGKAVLGQINRLSRQLVTETGEDWGKVAIASLSAPGVFEPDSDHMDLAFNIPGFGKLALRAELEAALRVPVAIDNDVNLAAEGERWGGMA